ncbi:hypothetical protein Bbelb_410320 [Branchiostoma belcheri]|nr:hypothetical protein Bbelb_410320 [Branchiostoma belcheri]
MTEEFNEYFSSCATNLANEIPRTEGDPLRHVPQSTSTLYLQPVDETEVLNELLKLRTKKSTGLDKIPAKLLKDSAPVIVKPLTHIFNLSIATGEIPKEWKMARVSPIYKSGSREIVSNYRPVSILNVVSKVMEKLVHSQKLRHVEESVSVTDGVNIFKQVPSFTYLGVTLDSSLQWAAHAEKVTKKLLAGLSALSRAKPFVTIHSSGHHWYTTNYVQHFVIFTSGLLCHCLVASATDLQQDKNTATEQAAEPCCQNHYRQNFAGPNGNLSVGKEELEAHLNTTYSDQDKDKPLESPGYVPRPAEPSDPMDVSPPRRAGGVLIPKEKASTTIHQFRNISLLNVEGKLFFTVLAKRLTKYLTSNNYIDTEIQKAGIPGFPGCTGHASTIWRQIQIARSQKEDLHVVWLDLANAYGSIPHKVIRYALEFFWVPVEVKQLMENYFSDFKLCISTRDYVTKWQQLEKGIAMGCSISPLLFTMGFEILLLGAKQVVGGVRAPSGEKMPPA